MQGQVRILGVVILGALLVGVPSEGWAKDRKPPKIRHKKVTAANAGEALEIRVKITDPSGVFDPTLYYRSFGGSEYLRATLVEGKGVYVATIPAAAVSSDIEYFVEAYDELGNGPARVGSPAKPLRIRVLTSHNGDTTSTTTVPPPKDPVPPPDEGGTTTGEGGETGQGETGGGETGGGETDPGVQPNGEGEGAGTGEGAPPAGSEVDEGEGDAMIWAIAAGAAGAVLVAGAGTAAVVYFVFFNQAEPPGTVTLEVSGPPPVSALRGAP